MNSNYVAQVRGCTHRYGETLALGAVDLDIPAGRMAGFMGTVARSMPQLGLLMILVLLPLQLLSGGITPRESMPEVVQNLMLLAPTTHFVKISQAVLYRAAGIEVVWPAFLAIIAIGSVFFLVALARFRRSISLTQV